MALFNFSPNLPATADEYEYYFPWATNPELAAANLLERGGLQPGASPVGGFAQQLLPGYALLSQLQRTIGGQAAPTSDVTQDVGRFAGLGGGVGDPNIIKGLADLEGKRAGGGLNVAQESLLNRYSQDGESDIGQITNLLQTSLGNRLAPMLRSRNVLGRTVEDMYRRFRNESPSQPNRGFFNFLSSRTGF